ncbi:hypothetical protein [Nocardia sp. NPDC004722]
MNRRIAGMISALAATAAGFTIVACASTVDGTAVANQAEVTTYRSSVAAASSSAAAATSAALVSHQNAVCGVFVADALDVAGKIHTANQRLDEHDLTAARTAITDAATALNNAGTEVSDALTKNPTPADFAAALTEYSKAATAFGGQMTKLGLGNSNDADFDPAQDRYFTAKDAALTACS